MLKFRGFTIDGRRHVEWRHNNSHSRWEPLDMCQWLRNHSPDGPNWGYGGSGPAQLALALVYAVYKDRDVAERVYQRFKFSVIGAIRADHWELDEHDIRAVVEALLGEPAIGPAVGGDDEE